MLNAQSASVEYRPSPFCSDYLIGDDGSVWSCRFGKRLRLKFQYTACGYFKVGLNVKGVRTFHLVHRLVLAAFVGPCPHGYEACHANDIPDDNRLVNLRWDTKKNNTAGKKVRYGGPTDNAGERNGRAKLTAGQVKEIKAKYAAGGVTKKSLADEYGVGGPAICGIINGKMWRNAP